MKPGLVGGQELGARLSRPDDWARDYWIAFDRPNTDWLPAELLDDHGFGVRAQRSCVSLPGVVDRRVSMPWIVRRGIYRGLRPLRDT